MKKYKIITLGCKVNTYESNAIAEKLIKDGYVEASNNEEADIVIINTCSVTHVSDAKSRQMIRRAIKNNPNAKIGVMGCYSQMASKEISEIEGVNVIVGTNNRESLLPLIYSSNSNEPVIEIKEYSKKDNYEKLSLSSYEDNTRAFIKVQDGCNNFCSYCIIPYARGRLRSRDLNDILKETKQLVENGYKEIVLTGIHTGAYGMDEGDLRLVDVIKAMIRENPSLSRIRISSIEIVEIDDELLNIIATSKVVVDHLHIPLQSGCDKILKLMNRRYDCAKFLEIVNKIRNVVPDIALTTDVIVGFPQENDEDFNETVEFIKKVNFSEIHVFPYSPRSGTPAASMKGQVHPTIKKERVETLLNLSKELHHSYMEKFIGKEVEVLFEEKDKTSNWIQGKSSNYLKVYAKGDESLLNKIVKVKIDRILDNHAISIII